MGGKGPAPKDPSTRARRNDPTKGMRLVAGHKVAQPDLPTFQITEDGTLVEFVWPQRTREWWASWGASGLSDEFGATDWEFLLDTALLHAAVWSGRLSYLGELRLRESKFGATPEDRLRLKIQFEAADAAEDAGTKRRARATPKKKPGDGDDPRQALRSV